MRLRADTGEIEEVLADWWQEFSMANDALRADMVEQVRAEQGRKVTRAPRPARNRPAQVPDTDGQDADAPESDAADAADANDASTAADAPRKRRRRRRPGGAKPAGGVDNPSGQ
jgi:poly(A) polymerase